MGLNHHFLISYLCDLPTWFQRGKPHRVPLSARALEILREAEKLDDGSGLIFPGTKHGKPLSDMTLSKLVKELGFDADVHGFRPLVPHLGAGADQLSP